ncbi:MAG: DUF1868 domain-containing protein [Pseudomonadota bacterium]
MAMRPVKTRILDLVDDGKLGPPPFVGSRFSEEGVFLRERGNTVVSHLVKGSGSEEALLDIRRQMMTLPYADHFAFTAASSLHMTVAQGVLETRRLPGYWPEGIDLETPVEEITRLYLDRFAGLEDQGPYQVRVDEVTPYGVTVSGATVEDEETLRRWRDHLCGPFGYRHPDHEAYVFHITVAYLKKWLPSEAVALYEAELENLLGQLKRTCPVLELDRPALCSFNDMNHFEPLLYLR